MLSNLTSKTWWKLTAARILKTVIAVALPYLGVAALADIQWWAILSAGLIAALGSFITSVLSLPDDANVTLPLQLLERGVKTFLQSVAAGIGTAVFVTDVHWLTVLETSTLATAVTVLIALSSKLPSAKADE